MRKCEELCEAALKAFLAQSEQSAAWEPTFTPEYTREVMRRVIKRAGKAQTVGCTVNQGKLTLYRKGVRAMVLEPAEPPKKSAARETLEEFVHLGIPRARVSGGMKEYQSLYRICGRGVFRHVHVHMDLGDVFLERDDYGR